MSKNVTANAETITKLADLFEKRALAQEEQKRVDEEIKRVLAEGRQALREKPADWKPTSEATATAEAAPTKRGRPRIHPKTTKPGDLILAMAQRSRGGKFSKEEAQKELDKAGFEGVKAGTILGRFVFSKKVQALKDNWFKFVDAPAEEA